MTQTRGIDQHLEVIEKIVKFSIFGKNYFGKISEYLSEYGTYLVKSTKSLDTGEETEYQIELEFNEIEEIYEEPLWYYTSDNFVILCHMNMGIQKSERVLHKIKNSQYFDIRFSEFANNPELLKFTPFVGTQIDKDNTQWFAGYLLAFDKYNNRYSKTVVKEFLINNPLVSIMIRNRYKDKESFIEVYNKLSQSVKE